MRKTKVRVVGDPGLAEKILHCLKEHFECTSQRYRNMPTRYARSNSPGISIYVDIKKEKETKP